MYQKRYPKSWWYHLKLCFNKKLMLLLRDKPYIKSQVIGAVVMGEREGIELEQTLVLAVCAPPEKPIITQQGQAGCVDLEVHSFVATT